MIPFGTLFNVATVLIGSTIGLVFKKMIASIFSPKAGQCHPLLKYRFFHRAQHF